MLKLVIHSLKNKKNWFLLNLAITVIITIIMPTLFRANYGFFSAFTMILSAGLILVSSFKELSFLHDDRKISYYLSKPINMMNKINIALISNAIFTTVVFLLTFAISSLAGAIFSANDPANVLEGFKYIEFVNSSLTFVKSLYAWLMTIGFVIIISSALTGNDTVSVFVTIFNYAIPAIIYLVITFICNILDNSIVGVSSEVMVQSFVDKFLPLEKIYFADYFFKKAIDVIYFLRLVIYFGIVYTLTIFAVKTRKNERTGDFIVHNGFKYFISIFVSLLLPMFVTSNMRNYDIFTVVAVLILLSALSYYILISVLDRGFRISKQAIQIYIPFIIIFVASIFIGSVALKARTAFIPDSSDIKAVYVGSNTSYLKDAKYLRKTEYKWDSLIKASYDDIKDNDSVLVLQEKESIEKVIMLQKALMNKKEEENYYRNLYIIYFLDNGKKVIRSYNIPYDYEDYSILMEIGDLARTEEFIQKRFKVFNDEEYINNVRFSNVYVYSNGQQHNLANFNYKKFAELYVEDYRSFINNDENIKKLHTNILLDIHMYDFIKRDSGYKEILGKEVYGDENMINFESTVDDGLNLQYVVLPNEFVKTISFIESIK